MAFKARKTRQKKEAEPVAQGRQLIPPAPAKEKYQRKLDALLSIMHDEYMAESEKILRNTSAADAKESKISRAFNRRREAFNKKFDELKARWTKIFQREANKIAKVFVDDVDAHSKATMKMSLTTLGIEDPTLTYSRNIMNTKKVQEDYNDTLISGIQPTYHEKMYSTVMKSLSSPNPEEQGQGAIVKALNEIGITEKKRVKLIARDQTSKVYSALNEDRMRQNGVTHFRWIHSSAAKVPRHTHLARNNQIFELNDPRLWEGPKADQGPPGYAINCGCRAVPVLITE